MIQLWLTEKDGPRRFDLGRYKARTEAEAVRMAENRHPFIGRLMKHAFAYESKEVQDAREHNKMGKTDR